VPDSWPSGLLDLRHRPLKLDAVLPAVGSPD
jgi:hypothetical protein